MKSIGSPADLAINGAAPAFPGGLPVGRPNIGDRDLFHALCSDLLERRVLSNNGPLLQQLESTLARLLGVRHVIAMCNGTIALESALRALDVEGEVIVPSYTFIATAHAASWVGLTPVFADIDCDSHNIDPAAVEPLITARTSAIVATHLWGRPAAIERLTSIAKRYRLRLLFDAAHAFGCSYRGRMIGGFGDCEVMSFHATKYFNTFEGGAVVTNSDELAERVRRIRNFGFSAVDKVVELGTNGKMTEVCAAMGIANLAKIDGFLATNRRNYDAYRQELVGAQDLRLLPYDVTERNNYQYVVVEVLDGGPVVRDRLIVALEAEGVMARRYFWPGCHAAQPYVANVRTSAALERTTKVADRVIVLPTGSAVSPEAAGTIARTLKVALAEARSGRCA